MTLEGNISIISYRLCILVFIALCWCCIKINFVDVIAVVCRIDFADY